MRRVASGEYNPSAERCLELKSNPAAQIMAIRKQALENLRAENEALLNRLKVVDRTKGDARAEEGEGLVPRDSFDRLVKEKEDLERSHEKRLQRLKEVHISTSPSHSVLLCLVALGFRYDRQTQPYLCPVIDNE